MTRTKGYNPIRRLQTEEESDAIADEILELLEKENIDFTKVDGDVVGYTNIAIELIDMIKGAYAPFLIFIKKYVIILYKEK